MPGLLVDVPAACLKPLLQPMAALCACIVCQRDWGHTLGGVAAPVFNMTCTTSAACARLSVLSF